MFVNMGNLDTSSWLLLGWERGDGDDPAARNRPGCRDAGFRDGGGSTRRSRQRKLAEAAAEAAGRAAGSSPWLSTPTALSKNQLSESLKLGKRGIMLPNRMERHLAREFREPESCRQRALREK